MHELENEFESVQRTLQQQLAGIQSENYEAEEAIAECTANLESLQQIPAEQRKPSYIPTMKKRLAKMEKQRDSAK